MGTVDDQSPVVKYSNDWRRITDLKAFNDTTTWSEVPEETVTLQFTGTGIGVYGVIASIGRRGAPVSAYSIDGTTATTFTGTQTSKDQYDVLFFQSPQLAFGGHTLVITTKSENIFYLDYFQITNSPLPLSNPAAGSSSGQTLTVTQSAVASSSPLADTRVSSTSVQSSLTSTITGSSASGSATEADRPSSPGTLLATVTVTSNGAPSEAALSKGATVSKSSGPIIGGILGGVFLLVLSGLLLLWIWRRRNMNGTISLSSPNYNSSSALPLQPTRMTEVTPFHLSDGDSRSHTINASFQSTALSIDQPSSGIVSRGRYPQTTIPVASESSAAQGLDYVSNYNSTSLSMSGGVFEKQRMNSMQSEADPGHDPPPRYVQ